MFKKVLNTPGFWKGVLSMMLAFIFFFLVIKWALEGFDTSYFKNIDNPVQIGLGLLVSGFIYGFLSTFGKFWARLKRNEH